jgi:hypothetical protein
MRHLLQHENPIVDFVDNFVRRIRRLRSKMVVNLAQVFRRRGQPEKSHLLREHGLHTPVHLIFFDEFATVGLLNALEDDPALALVLIQQPQRNIGQQRVYRDALMLCQLGQPCLLLGSKVQHHR